VSTGEISFSQPISTVTVTPGNFSVLLSNNTAKLMAAGENLIVNSLEQIPVKGGTKINWQTLLDLYPGKFRSGLSYIELTKPDNRKIVGYLTLNGSDESNMELINVQFDGETLLNSDLPDLSNTFVRGTINAIINPLTFNPGTPEVDTRYLILEDITATEEDGPTAWLNADSSAFSASANDIIQWDGVKWNVIFNSLTTTAITYITNSYTGIQYQWDGEQWSKSIDGMYYPKEWRLVL